MYTSEVYHPFPLRYWHIHSYRDHTTVRRQGNVMHLVLRFLPRRTRTARQRGVLEEVNRLEEKSRVSETKDSRETKRWSERQITNKQQNRPPYPNLKITHGRTRSLSQKNLKRIAFWNFPTAVGSVKYVTWHHQ